MEAYDDVERGSSGSGGLNLNADLLKNPLVIGGGAFVVGLIIGLVVLGWGLFPVRWTDAAAEHLRADLQEDYARMVVDSYTLNGDLALADQRLSELGDNATEVMGRVLANPGNQNTESIAQLTAGMGEDIVTPEEEPAEEEESGGGILSWTRILLLGACAVTVVAGGVLLVLFLMRRNSESGSEPVAAPAPVYAEQEEYDDYAAGADQPLAQWMATYQVGNDRFDESFSIDSPNGDFLGECGVGIADTIGVGEPKRVSAFEVWLFDKNDIQTVTRVLMSEHTFKDTDIVERLAAKGEPLLATPGQELVLETEKLQMVARVVDMQYGDGAMPDHSFFDRMTVELAVWMKEEPPAMSY